MEKCQHCGMIHDTTCPRIKALDYYQDGTIKRVEFHSPARLITAGMVEGPVAPHAAPAREAQFVDFRINT